MNSTALLLLLAVLVLAAIGAYNWRSSPPPAHGRPGIVLGNNDIVVSTAGVRFSVPRSPVPSSASAARCGGTGPLWSFCRPRSTSPTSPAPIGEAIGTCVGARVSDLVGGVRHHAVQDTTFGGIAVIMRSSGDLLDADTEALVNAVNCVGVMGKGLALQFKQRFPAYFSAYAAACAAGEVRLGRVHVVTLNRCFISFPTKGHFRSRSKLSEVADGLDDLARVIGELGLRSVAVPPLGAGLGGLSWDDVEPLISAKLGALDATVLVYSPENATRLRL